ncbi:hypothetical protein [Geobacter argillaceus]|uniref:Uncharacterized protein n=1 Tax=Geobacter argillaceus TaxID=345631 RepID=A0A562WA25_9BACT|nr:hypothetical protein [Geobacter argillaceus]TWJ26534.1 hypothetical protein JN12_01246 [Geobacter argillaceus]
MIPTADSPETIKKLTRAQEIFKSATPEYQALIREILKEERDVMHLKRRSDIHQRLYEHVRRVIK